MDEGPSDGTRRDDCRRLTLCRVGPSRSDDADVVAGRQRALADLQRPVCGGDLGVARQCFFAVALPPLRPAACFGARFPPLPAPRLLLDWPLLPLWLFLPPLLDASGVLAIAAARDLLMPFSRSPSYCLSFLMDGP